MTTQSEQLDRKTKTAAVAARIPADLAAELRRRADARGETVSDVLGDVIRRDLSRSRAMTEADAPEEIDQALAAGELDRLLGQQREMA